MSNRQLSGKLSDPEEQVMPDQNDAIRSEVRRYYAAAATIVAAGESAGESAGETGCCGDDAPSFGSQLYDDLAGLPDAAALASMGCGNPTAVADLQPGDTVLDLGSGGGIDVLLSAKRVGPQGKVYGVDMTPEMLELARRNAIEANISNVEFLYGHIEQVPLPDETVDVVISNCVINLSRDKPAVFSEMNRILRQGGRVGVSDIVADDRLSAADRAERGNHVGCIAGALSVTEYRDELTAAGFTDIDIALAHAVADGLHAAIVKATKPTVEH